MLAKEGLRAAARGRRPAARRRPPGSTHSAKLPSQTTSGQPTGALSPPVRRIGRPESMQSLTEKELAPPEPFGARRRTAETPRKCTFKIAQAALQEHLAPPHPLCIRRPTCTNAAHTPRCHTIPPARQVRLTARGTRAPGLLRCRVARASCPCVPRPSRPGRAYAGPGWPCDTWARRPCHEHPLHTTAASARPAGPVGGAGRLVECG